MSANRQSIASAIREYIGSHRRTQSQVWAAVSKRYPQTTYAEFDRVMSSLELRGEVELTGTSGPNVWVIREPRLRAVAPEKL